MTAAPDDQTAAGAADVPTRTRRAQGLIEHAQFAEAERLARWTLDDATADERPDLLYLIAVAQRFLGRPARALRTLEVLQREAPDFGRGWQERGHTLLALNRPDDAQQAFARAVRHNPALLASWKAVVRLYQRSKAFRAETARASAQIDWLESLPPALRSAASLMHEGQLARADARCRDYLRSDRQHIEGMRLLASIGERMGVMLDAQFLLETANALAPEHDGVRYDLANLLLKMQRFRDAEALTRSLFEAAPDDPARIALHANALAGLGDHEAAIGLYEGVLRRAGGQASLLVMKGHAEKALGRLDAAIESYRAAYRIRPEYGDAYWSLANTKTYRFEYDELRRMQEAEADRGTRPEDRIHLCFALGKAYEDGGQFERSFEYYDRGNTLRRAASPHSPERLDARIDAQLQVFTREFLQARAGTGCQAPDPIFIVGLPRAGSTLIEQILSSHSRIDGTMELPHVIALAQRLHRGGQRGALDRGEPGDPDRRGYPWLLRDLDVDYLRRFGEQFIEDTRVYRAGAPLFIDKNPNNFFNVGLIHLILPNARIIDARRQPMACCFSGFKQLFGQGQDFSYGLAEIGHYYRRYVDLMDHWDRVLPGKVLRVMNEDVVEDLEGEVRRMLDHLGLEFEESTLRFFENERSVRTPSSEQVRRPVNRDGFDVWRAYEPWLAPLKKALGPALADG